MLQQQQQQYGKVLGVVGSSSLSTNTVVLLFLSLLLMLHHTITPMSAAGVAPSSYLHGAIDMKPQCRTIMEIVCNTDIFDAFCDFIQVVSSTSTSTSTFTTASIDSNLDLYSDFDFNSDYLGTTTVTTTTTTTANGMNLEQELHDKNKEFTLFVPTNTAIENCLGIETIKSLLMLSPSPRSMPLSSSRSSSSSSSSSSNYTDDSISMEDVEDEVDAGTPTQIQTTSTSTSSPIPTPTPTTSSGLLLDMLLFHLVPNQALENSDLICDDILIMGNGNETAISCDGDNDGNENDNMNGLKTISPFDTSAENRKDEEGLERGSNAVQVQQQPQIVVTNIQACNGIIHIIDGVLLNSDDRTQLIDVGVIDHQKKEQEEENQEKVMEEPDQKPKPDDDREKEKSVVVECLSIEEIICGEMSLETFCGFLDDENVLMKTATTVGGEEEEDNYDDVWTVFAPTDTAFGFVQDEVLDGLDPATIVDILQFHVIQGKVLLSDDLSCDGEVTMYNSQQSKTLCSPYSDNLFQIGPANVNSHSPRIMIRDIAACNGVVHIVSQLLLPDF